jgi:hypothetical protein
MGMRITSSQIEMFGVWRRGNYLCFVVFAAMQGGMGWISAVALWLLAGDLIAERGAEAAMWWACNCRCVVKKLVINSSFVTVAAATYGVLMRCSDIIFPLWQAKTVSYIPCSVYPCSLLGQGQFIKVQSQWHT